MEDKKRAIKVSTLDELAAGFQESRGIPDKLTMKQMIAFAKEPVGGGENKLNQVLTKTITELTAEDTQGATSIGQSLCASCKQLTKVEMSPSITSIGSNAFGYCNKLESVTFSPNITLIDNKAFQQCWKFSSPIVLPNVTTINDYAFNRCDYAPYVILPKVKQIKSNAFLASDDITFIRIGNQITQIGSSAFGIFNLTDIYIDKEEGSVSGAPWGATNATIHWNTPIPDEYLPSEEA